MKVPNRFGLAVVAVLLAWPRPSVGQEDSSVVARGDSVSIRLSGTDLRLALQALGRYLDRPVILGPIGDFRVTLETPQPIPRTRLPDLIRGVLRSYGLSMTEEPGFFSVGTTPAEATRDASAGPAPPRLFVIPLRHARAADVASTVSALYGQASGQADAGQSRATLAESLRENLIPPADARDSVARPVTPGVAQFAGPVTVVADPRTNSLLVRASQEDFELVQAAVDQLDVRPLQVLIEVVIAEVRRDRGLSFGLETAFEGTEVSGSTKGLGIGDLVLRLMKLGRTEFTATLAAAASRGDVSILSRPVVLAANNEPAEILVGSQRPFIQVQRALPTDAPVRDQVVQFKDVGTRLSVRPTISADGYVMLQVSQEVNAATAEVAFDAPVISTRTIQTQLLVLDGRTAVLGGLTDQQRELTRAGVPILSAIPLIGGLFGSQVKRTSETELFIFITPRVIRTDADLDEATDGAGERTRAVRGAAGRDPGRGSVRRGANPGSVP